MNNVKFLKTTLKDNEVGDLSLIDLESSITHSSQQEQDTDTEIKEDPVGVLYENKIVQSPLHLMCRVYLLLRGYFSENKTLNLNYFGGDDFDPTEVTLLRVMLFCKHFPYAPLVVLHNTMRQVVNIIYSLNGNSENTKEHLRLFFNPNSQFVVPEWLTDDIDYNSYKFKGSSFLVDHSNIHLKNDRFRLFWDKYSHVFIHHSLYFPLLNLRTFFPMARRSKKRLNTFKLAQNIYLIIKRLNPLDFNNCWRFVQVYQRMRGDVIINKKWIVPKVFELNEHLSNDLLITDDLLQKVKEIELNDDDMDVWEQLLVV